MKGFVGVTGPIEFQPAGDIVRKYLIVGIEKGEWVIKTNYDYARLTLIPPENWKGFVMQYGGSGEKERSETLSFRDPLKI